MVSYKTVAAHFNIQPTLVMATHRPSRWLDAEKRSEIRCGALKLLGMGLVAALTVACSTGHGSVRRHWEGQVWRAFVVLPAMDTVSKGPSDMYWIQQVNYDDERDRGLRLALVGFNVGVNPATGKRDSVAAGAVVPDQMEFSQLKKGTIVDVWTEPADTVDYSKRRFTHILRIVCADDDRTCKEKNPHSLRIPGYISVSQNTGATTPVFTFNRRITQEEYDAR